MTATYRRSRMRWVSVAPGLCSGAIDREAGRAVPGIAFEPRVRRLPLIPYCAASSIIVNGSVAYSRTKSRRCSMRDVSRHGIEAPPAMQAPVPVANHVTHVATRPVALGRPSVAWSR